MAFENLKLKHGYEIDGIWYPRVTSICRIIAKPGLERWLANQGSFAAMQEKRKKVTGWGRLIHDIAQKILLDKMPKIDPVIRPSIEGFFDWLNTHKVKTFEVEKRVLNKKHLYAGTLDVLAEIDGRFGVLDIKTSREIWDDHFIQTAAYFQAYNEQVSKKAKTHWILKIDQYQGCSWCGAEKREKGGEAEIKRARKNCNHQWMEYRGTFELKEVSNHRIYFNGFLNAKKLWEFSNRHRLLKIKNYSNRFNSL